ncbi:CDP-glucose 4,6-dehydratase [Paracoccus sediminicola]|uniref:CDP-glucose 4,6-dehydratase n=1 Tax=Paracoccus sediminicola TaxID=3017783 RepID=UPI0022F0070C|nr:CDP-glucose 4,6-dehydratase [Paracoccus sediminicola]WBU56442.1 CDP-glucose 4,6-dehydratase [Paracoccus sediminicola]
MTSDIPGPEFGAAFSGKRVLLTGHTGFKGSWLTLWLHQLGAEVLGVSRPPETQPSLFEVAGVEGLCDSRNADINDAAALSEAVGDFQPDLIIHMAAQAIVRDSYDIPVETFTTNVVGTANVLEIARRSPQLQGVVVVTSDKCYENNEWEWGYREVDPLGGSDPYSASKACTELVAQAYRRSFFSDPKGPQLASVRAGNVIGGGDWAAHRLIPDIIRAIAAGEDTVIRNPASVRPWQHVLEPLSGYLTVAEKMLSGKGDVAAGAWNFGPDSDATVPVGDLCRMFGRLWGDEGPRFTFHSNADAPHEAGLLRLDSTRAKLHLGWHPQLCLEEALSMTADWYRRHAEGGDMRQHSLDQIKKYAARLSPPPDLSTNAELSR